MLAYHWRVHCETIFSLCDFISLRAQPSIDPSKTTKLKSILEYRAGNKRLFLRY
jgi:hypothetical protein